MKIKIFITLLLYSCLSSLAAKAQQADTLRLSLVEAVNLAITQNPQLKSTQLNEDIKSLK